MNDSENTTRHIPQSRSTAGLGCMPDEEYGLCKLECPMLAKWGHPFWNHTAWCWHLMKDLNWYDYWRADCLCEEPNETLLKIRECGRTPPPNVELRGGPAASSPERPA